MFGQKPKSCPRRWSSRSRTISKTWSKSQRNWWGWWLLSPSKNSYIHLLTYTKIIKRYAEALEVIPYTLAENAALNPIEVVTELRKRHNAGEQNTGINVRKVILLILYNLYNCVTTCFDICNRFYLGWRVRYGNGRSVSTTFSFLIDGYTCNRMC